MKVILFGATGMIGQGVLRECLLDPEVQQILAIGRGPSGATDPKVRDLVHPDLYDLGPIEAQLAGYDACFFCLGVSSAGMSEQDYKRVTYDLTLGAAEAIARQSPAMTFIYVSGQSTDGTEKGRVMWARVKGATENALLRLPFAGAYMFRPGAIVPMHGIVPRSKVYRVMYVLLGPLIWLLKDSAPTIVTTSERVGRAMLAVAKHGAAKRVLESEDINAIGAAAGS